jgi:hypothetical protein
MKLKIVIVDFEPPPHVKRWGLRIGIPAVILGIGAVALATPPWPHVWANGDLLDAGDLNGNFTNLTTYAGGLETRIAALEASRVQSGASTPLRIEAASITGGPPPAIAYQTSSWLSVDFPNCSAGYYAFNFTSAFSAVPVCVVTASPTGGVVPVAYVRRLSATSLALEFEDTTGHRRTGMLS